MTRFRMLIAATSLLALGIGPVDGAEIPKDVLTMDVVADSGASPVFRLTTTGFVTFGVVRDEAGLISAPVRITLAGVGEARLVSADTMRLVAANVKITTVEGTTTPQRYAGRQLRISRGSLTSQYLVTKF
jgi:hypothetical protein